MSAPPAPALDPVAEQTGVALRTGTDRAPGSGRARRAPRIRRLVVVVVVVVLVAVAVLTLVGLAGRQGADDPGSPQRTGSAAIAQLLRDQGVRVVRSTDVDDAVDAVRAVPAAADGRRAVTVLVVQPDRLSTDQVAALTAAAPARTVLLTPGTTALGRFGVGGTSSVADAGPSVSPGCADPDAQRAGAVEVADARRYRVSGGSACYPDADGAVLVSLSRAGGRTDLLGLPFRNRTLAAQGNAALGTALLGSQPTLVWLMTPPPAAATTGGRPPRCSRPGGRQRCCRPWSRWWRSGCGRAAASARSSASGCRCWCGRARRWRATGGSTTGSRPATAPPPPSGPG